MTNPELIALIQIEMIDTPYVAKIFACTDGDDFQAFIIDGDEISEIFKEKHEKDLYPAATEWFQERYDGVKRLKPIELDLYSRDWAKAQRVIPGLRVSTNFS